MGEDAISVEDVERAREAIEGLVNRTPALRVPEIDARCGCTVALKAESLQQSGSFKLRGASNKMLGSERARSSGVAAGTAGNHGHAVALAARRLGVRCDLFVPTDAPVSKTFPAERLGARLQTRAGTVDDCVEAAREFAEERGVELIHPFDDAAVIAGQGTIGLELLEEIEDLARVVIPLGGGGLAGGIATVLKARRPEVEVVGVQAEACAPYPGSLRAGEPVAVAAAQTVADGIAVKRPGRLTLPLVERYLDRIVVVSEDEVGDAMALLLGEAKLVVEGAGAVGVAALISGHEGPPAAGVSAIVLSGGNIDEEWLVAVARRGEAQQGRGLIIFTTIGDRPGALAKLLAAVAATGANVSDVRHIREGVNLGIAETGVELILETRGAEHGKKIVAALSEAGYEMRDITHPE
ncbi:MAG: threonine ammonia-lyase [Solirubrobacterales bacterium]